MKVAFNSEQILKDMQNLWIGKVPHENDFNFFKIMSNSKKIITFLDCGANSGQSAISFLMNCQNGHVISFEPNDLYRPVLQGVRNFLGFERFEFFMEGLSDENKNLDLYIPYVDGLPYLQEGSLIESHFSKPWVDERLKTYGENLKIVPIRANFVTADSKKLKIDVVKIDAEGAEMRVLKGMMATILKYKPVFLIENNDFESVTNFLNDLGYNPYQWKPDIQQLSVMTGPSTNCFYLLKDHFSIYKIRAVM